MHLDPKGLEALQDAIEGECDGLAIDDDQARAILTHVFSATAPSDVSGLAEPVAYMRMVKHSDCNGLELPQQCTKLHRDAFAVYRHPPTIASDNAALRAENDAAWREFGNVPRDRSLAAHTKAALDELAKMAGDERDRADRAEAALTEKDKALDLVIDTGRITSGGIRRPAKYIQISAEAFELARRARQTGGSK